MKLKTVMAVLIAAAFAPSVEWALAWFPGEGFLVLSLLAPPDAFADGVTRLLARLGAVDVL